MKSVHLPLSTASAQCASRTIGGPSPGTASLRSTLSVRSIVLVMLAFLALCAEAATTFSFTLPIAARTSAGVYRSDGTLIRTLWNEEPFVAGTHSRTWDDKDYSGNQAPAGTYTF